MPRLVAEPFTLEPTEAYTLDELDEYVSAFQRLSDEAYDDPEGVKGAPYKAAADQHDEAVFNDPFRWAMTWKAYPRKGGQRAG